jgi:hypothetical protein
MVSRPASPGPIEDVFPVWTASDAELKAAAKEARSNPRPPKSIVSREKTLLA